MDATQEINFYNNFDLIAKTLKDQDVQLLKSINEIAVYVAGLHIELREKETNLKYLKDEIRKRDNDIERLEFMVS